MLAGFQVSDAENILGIVQIENIQVHAEAYDVALDISFPKGQSFPHKLSLVWGVLLRITEVFINKQVGQVGEWLRQKSVGK